MASATGLMEGQSHFRPPLFDGKDYSIWKNKMKAFLRAKDPLEWELVQNGVSPNSSSSKEISSDADLQTQSELKKRQDTDAKAIHSLYCALSTSEYNRISSCDSAKEIWDILSVTYEGTDRVKETRTNILLNQYESFKMKEGESITDMFSRFTEITNGLAYQGHPVEGQMKVNKLLRGLTSEWTYIKTSIRETQRIQPLSLDELVGTLQAYEEEKLVETENTRGKKTLALKSNEDFNDAESEDYLNDEEIALLVKRFKKFNRNNRSSSNQMNSQRRGMEDGQQSFQKHRLSNSQQNFQRRRPRYYQQNTLRQSTEAEGQYADVTCFNCKKKGHIKPDCPLLKKGRDEKYKRALKAETWSDTECESSDDQFNVCLMANSDGSDSDYESDYNENQVSNLRVPIKIARYIDELCSDLEDSLKEISDLKKENQRLKRQEVFLKEKIEILQKDSSCLEQKVDSLEKENVCLKSDFSCLSKRFSDGSEKLEKILSIQRPYFKKEGLGMSSTTVPLIDFPKVKERLMQRPSKKVYEDHFKKVFVKPVGDDSLFLSSNNSEYLDREHSKSKSSVFGLFGFSTNSTGPKRMWVPKRTVTGPKKVWVPKKV